MASRRLRPRAVLAAGCAVALSAIIGCTPTPPGAESTSTTTTTAEEPPTTMPLGGTDLPPPPLPDPDTVASEAVTTIPGYRDIGTPGLFEADALTAIRLWLPTQIVAGTSARSVEDADGNQIVALWVNPIMAWRGDPGIVGALADLEGTSDPAMVGTGVYRTTIEGGLTVHLWSTGDGFVVAAAVAAQAAADYLEALESQRTPRAVWSTGSCLYLEPSTGLPWAPVAIDAQVPCTGPHNAEVILSTRSAEGLETFDEDDIAYRRNHECDIAYERAIGPQRDHTPSLITYMPDAEEFARGDRYLACVVQLTTPDGPSLVSGRITDRDDTTWRPTIGSCFAANLAPEAVPCDEAHVYEFVGEATATADAWPRDDRATFAAACSPFLDDLEAGNASIDVFPMGLYPHAFEQGERRIRCMAYADDETGPATVIGSFSEEWRILGRDGIAA